MKQPAWLGLVLLISLCLTLQPAYGGALLGLAALLWPRLDVRPIRRRWVAVALFIAALLLLAEHRFEAAPGSPRWIERAQRSVDQEFAELQDSATRAIARIPDTPNSDTPLETFELLEGLARDDPTVSWYVIDPDGEALAWAGPGLLHEVEGRALPPGPDRLSSYTATSLLYTTTMDDGIRPWSLVVGKTYGRREPPLPARLIRDVAIEDWSLQRGDTASGYTFILRSAHVTGSWRGAWWRAASALLGVVLLSLLIERGSNREGLLGRREVGLQIITGVLGLEAILAAFEVDLVAIASLAVGGLFALAMSQLSRPNGESMNDYRTLLRSALGVFALLALVASYVALLGPRTLGNTLEFEVGDIALRTSLLAAFLSILWSGPVLRGGRPRLTPAVLCFALLLVAAFSLERPILALVLLLLATAGGASWIAVRSRTDGGPILALLVFAALGSSVAWELGTAFMLPNESRSAEVVVLSLEDRRLALEDFFHGAQADEIVNRSVDVGESRDLAVALWRASPFSDRAGLSAILVESPKIETSSFSWGLPLVRGRFDPGLLEERGLLDTRGVLEWLESEIEIVTDADAFRLHYWWVPLEGTQPTTGGGSVELDLLRGGAVRPIASALSGGGQQPSVRPGLPPSAASLARSGRFVRGDPTQDPADSLRGNGGWNGLELVGTQALMGLLPCGLVGLAVFLLNLSGRAFRDRARTWLRSYSRRLVVLLSGLVLVPLVLVNAVQLRNLGNRLEAENREAGEVALHFAQRVLNDYLVALDPGFGLRTALNEEILEWLSEVVDREVNVYWAGRTFASSRPELYSSGLLPTRIPGEVYSELSLRGAGLTARRNQVGSVAYLELYAPLDLGQDIAPSFFVSTPLLAQQEAVSEELAQLQRQAILVTALIFLLLTTVGSVLARNFTRPLLQIVEGTERIARGAESLGLEPTEPELASLTEAIDDMAAHIAEGRRALLSEKRVVEEVVENITAGVVSVDRQGRVLMRNRVAEQLLGVEVGDDLVERLGATPELSPLVKFVGEERSVSHQRTLTVERESGETLEWNVVWVPVAGAGEPSALFVVEDATEVLRGQRLQAWAEMARIIAHEIKNPLTPIRLSTEHLQRVYQDDPAHLDGVFERCTDNILREVEELRRISHEFSTYSHIPEAELSSHDLRDLVSRVVNAYESVSQADGVGLELDLGNLPLRAWVDPRLLGRALRNLIENALRANQRKGTVRISCAPEGDRAMIEVADSGPGVAPEILSRIFDPYFSTHDSGTGLGLPIARRIVEEHGGTITARNLENGLMVQISLPLEPS